MKILITGIAGFVGSTLAREIRRHRSEVEIIGLDNFSRAGSEYNRSLLARENIPVVHADIRNASDFETFPKVDWVIDAAANPSVLAGVDGKSSSRQLVEHNLWGTVNLLEFCKARNAGFTLLSTSRVYAIKPLTEVQYRVEKDALAPDPNQVFPEGLGPNGVAESFSTRAPISLYGSTKLASEQLALEYGATFGFPVWINRCGVLAGAGQFGRPDQGIFSFWIHSWRARRPLKYIGFEGKGHQVRDCLHPRDLVGLLLRQMEQRSAENDQIFNLGGGLSNSMSLKQVSDWCAERFGEHPVEADHTPRPFDLPWMVMNNQKVTNAFDWQPTTPIEDILAEIADHADRNPDWLTRSGV